MHPHLARKAIVRDVETTRYGRDYAGQRGKITHVDKDRRTRAATRYVVRMEKGGNEIRFESEEIRIIEAPQTDSINPLAMRASPMSGNRR